MAVLSINAENFQKEVMESDQVVLLDFFADWCGPCRRLSPLLEEIAGEHAEIKVGKVNVEEQLELAERFGVMSIPALMVVKEGAVVEKAIGLQPKQKILEMLS